MLQEISDFFRQTDKRHAGRRAYRIFQIYSPGAQRLRGHWCLALVTTVYPFYWKALMQRRDQRSNPCQIASCHKSRRRTAMNTNTYRASSALRREIPLLQGANPPNSTTPDAALEFGRFRALLRQRQLLADGVPVELGTRAFDLLLVLLEADGSLVTKEELLSRVWPDIFVSEENLKVQVCAP